MSGLLSDVLPAIYSGSNKLKRLLGQVVDDPVGLLSQHINVLNEDAGNLNSLTSQSTQEGIDSIRAGNGLGLNGPASNRLASLLAESYNPVAMTVKFIPYGKTAKPLLPAAGAVLPENKMLTRVPNPASAYLVDNPNINIRDVGGGQYQSIFSPLWGSKSKPFIGVGDNLDELIQSSLSRADNSLRGGIASENAKQNASLLGQLQKEFGDIFKTANSERSASEYITHIPTGAKIRISDHDLPLGYSSPDLDLRSSMGKDAIFAAIKKYLYGD